MKSSIKAVVVLILVVLGISSVILTYVEVRTVSSLFASSRITESTDTLLLNATNNQNQNDSHGYTQPSVSTGTTNDTDNDYDNDNFPTNLQNPLSIEIPMAISATDKDRDTDDKSASASDPRNLPSASTTEGEPLQMDEAMTTTSDASSSSSSSETNPQSSEEMKPQQSTELTLPQTSPPQTPIVERPKLWVHVVGYGEGLASWKVSFTDMLMLAKHARAVLVEPCVSDGRLHSCRMSNHVSGYSIPLGQVFDLDRTRQLYYPHIATHEEFLQSTGYHFDDKTGLWEITRRKDNPKSSNTFYACLNRWGSCKYKYHKGYNVTASTPRILESSASQPKQHAIQAAMKHSKDKNVVTLLEILVEERTSLRRWNMGKRNKPPILETLAWDPEDVLQFHQSHYDKVESILHQALQLPQGAPYAAFQWRPERLKEDYMPCAQAILEARDIISQQDGVPKENFVLISPLSLIQELQWGPLAHEADQHKNTSYPSLQMLLDAGFKKMEQSFGIEKDNDNNSAITIPDEVYLVIYDFILVQKAKTFTTCSDCDDNAHFCSRCNWQGRASQYAISLRAKATNHTGTTRSCWPPTSQSTTMKPLPKEPRKRRGERRQIKQEQ